MGRSMIDWALDELSQSVEGTDTRPRVFFRLEKALANK